MKRLMTFLVLGVLLVNGTGANAQSEEEEKIGVVVTILPSADFVENIGRDKVEVSVMVPPGASPHTYEPTPSQLKKVSQARMYIKVGSGVEFELVWVDKLVALNKNMLVCDSSKGIKLMGMIEHHHHEEVEHEPKHRRHHHGNDPHIWLSLINARVMVENICNCLMKVNPGNKEFYARNMQEYIRKLNKLDKEIRSNLVQIENRKFIVFHPAWGYFARDYDLEQIPIEIGGKEPSAKDIANLIEEAKEHNIKVIFASPQFNPQSAKVIAKEIDGGVIFINPLAKNYITNMHNLVAKLIQSLE